METFSHQCTRCASRTSSTGTITFKSREAPVYTCSPCTIRIGSPKRPVHGAFVYAVDGRGKI